MSFGKFSGNPKTEWLTSAATDDRDMKMLEDFHYDDPAGRRWPAKAGSVINGASIPTALWSTVGSPYTGDYRLASIVHDVACDDPTVNRKQADEMFYHACLAGGCSKSQARVLYAGVRVGAWSGGFRLPFTSRTWSASPELYTLRPRGVVGLEEFEINQKFADLVGKIDQETGDLSFEELEKIVDRELGEPPLPIQ